MATVLIGRDAHREAIGLLADRIGTGGSSLIVRGAPGVGKSTLLRAVAEDLSGQGWRVVRTEGTPSEQRLLLAGLHKLLRPVMGYLDRLPTSRQDALLRAFGAIDAPPPGVFLVAQAALDLLAEVASSVPLLVLAEDTHWLDQSSADILGFVSRRLGSDRVLLIASSRYVDEDPLGDAGLPELDLPALDDPAAEQVLDQGSPGLSPSRRKKVLDAAAGNPLALVELPKALESSRGEVDFTGRLPMTDRLERTFAMRASNLPAAARDAVLIAALNDSDSLAELLAAFAAMRPDAGLADLGEALSAGLIDIEEPTVRFRHPLVRSAVHRSASLSRRQSAHEALAQVLSREPGRSLWHRAASIVGPDEEIAVELEGQALRAREGGAIDVAFSSMRRAAQLSDLAASRGRRLLGAAELAFELGRFEVAEELLADADELELEDSARLRLSWIREISDQGMSGGPERVDALIGLSGRASSAGNIDLALDFLRRAALRCWTLGMGTGPGDRVASATGQVDVEEADPRRIAIIAYASPLERGAEVIELLGRPGVTETEAPGDTHLLGHAAACTGDFATARGLCRAAAEGLREQGLLVQLTQVLRLLGLMELRCGRWDAALVAAEECERLAQETRQPMVRADALSVRATLAGLRGESDSADRLSAEAEHLSLQTGSTISLALVQGARATAAASSGRPADAFDQLWRIYRPEDPAHQRMQSCWAIGSLAEYAVQSGHREQAEAELSKLEPLIARTPAPGVHVGVRNARALLAGPAEAEARFRVALASDLGEWPFEAARARLGYGLWLRRRQRILEARAPLREARDAFDRLGAPGWADQARRELRAAGEGSLRHERHNWDELTAQEMQIARLVADGLTNKEIGYRLFLSHRTVASHLYRMFPKLGISSRVQLAQAASRHDESRGDHASL